MKFFLFCQRWSPKHLITRLVALFAASQINFVKKIFINKFIQAYNINMNEAEKSDPDEYESFNDFFTRHLKPDARPLAETGLLSPVDGTVSQIGKISFGKLIQAKHKNYSVTQLLGSNQLRSQVFSNGSFATMYLSPKNYHRIHMPCNATLKEMIYIPGKLYSVNPTTVNNIDDVFALNERVVCLFDTEYGQMAMVLVGATLVGSIHTSWAGQVNAGHSRKIKSWVYVKDTAINFRRGDEMGWFQLGSTVVLLFEKLIDWDKNIEQSTFMGEYIGQLNEH